MYVKLPGGTAHPDGYIVPCELTGKKSGGQTQIVLTSAIEDDLSWPQWVCNEQLLTDEEVESGN